MIVVGLTGGIGSGKSTVAKQFQDQYGIPVYSSDDEAKKLMLSSIEIKAELTALFGAKVYINNALNKPLISDAIFNNKTLLTKMNAIVHPRVAKHFKDWVEQQSAPYILKESAILFESKSDKFCDVVITVTLDKSTRIKRLLKRDNTTIEKLEAIMKQQWTDQQRIEKSNFVIVNDTLAHMQAQVDEIHKALLNKFV